MIQSARSSLSAGIKKIEEAVKMAEEARADLIHIDIAGKTSMNYKQNERNSIKA